jgi:hypothetical protein
MQYEVRFQIRGEEQSLVVEAETAATAVEEVHQQTGVGEDGFELIQVTLVDDESADEQVLANS